MRASRGDLVLVEGDSQVQAIKIEVWRAAVGASPLANDADVNFFNPGGTGGSRS